jgi:hypothetical protein
VSPHDVAKLLYEIEELRADLAQRTAERDRKAETVASLLNRISLIREAAGCEGVMLAELPSKIATLRADLATANAELSQRTAEVAKANAERDEAWLTSATLRADLARANAERDEARRELCIEHLSPEAEARRRGWNCFDAPHATDGRVQNGGA